VTVRGCSQNGMALLRQHPFGLRGRDSFPLCLGPPRPYLKRRWKILRFLCVELTTIEINLWCLISVLWCLLIFFLSPGSTLLLSPLFLFLSAIPSQCSFEKSGSSSPSCASAGAQRAQERADAVLGMTKIIGGCLVVELFS
jgi:hypothetical protein